MSRSTHEQAVLSEFGQLVRRARKFQGWTQIDLAEKAGMSRSYVGGVERGERNLGLLNVNKLALALGEGFEGFLPCLEGAPD